MDTKVGHMDKNHDTEPIHLRVHRRGWRPGLRLTLALGLGLVVLVGLLLVSMSVFGLIQRSTEQAHAEDTLALANALLGINPAPSQEILEAWVKHGLVEAAQAVARDGVSAYTAGVDHPTLRAALSAPGAAQIVADAQGVKSVAAVENAHFTLAIQRTAPALGQSLSAAQGLGALYMLLGAMGVLVFAFALLTRLLVNPVRHLVAATARVTGGDLSTRARVRGAGELADLSEHFNRMVEAVAGQRAELAAFAAEQQQANTALKRANLDLQQAQDHLKDTQESLIRAERLASIGQLSTGIAHEIGNPLASLMAYLDLLRDPETTDAERVDLLPRAQDAATRIQRTIRELLDYARPSPSDLQALDPVPAIRQAIRLVEPQKRMRHIRLSAELPQTLPLVRIDEGKLSQLVVNLLLNAADALQNKGEIVVSAQAFGDEVTISVHDSGPGIPADMMPHILKPFFTTKPPGQGTGLGLAVCDQIAHQFQGIFSVESQPNQGTTFRLRLPVAAEGTVAASKA